MVREREPEIQTSFSYTLFERFQITILYFDWFALNIGYENTIVMRLIHFYPLHLFGSIVKRFLFSPPHSISSLFIPKNNDRKNRNVSIQFLTCRVFSFMFCQIWFTQCQKKNLNKIKTVFLRPYWCSDVIINYLLKDCVIRSTQFLSDIFTHNTDARTES